MVISYPTASFISIYIYSYGGYYAIWGTSLGVGLITLLYIIFVIKDSRGRESEELQNDAALSVNFDAEDPENSQFNFFFVVSNLWECFAVTFQPRNGYKRACLAILLGSMCLFVFQSMFGWPINENYCSWYWLFFSQFLDRLCISTLENYLSGTNPNLPCFQQLEVWLLFSVTTSFWILYSSFTIHRSKWFFFSFQEAFCYCHSLAQFGKFVMV